MSPDVWFGLSMFLLGLVGGVGTVVLFAMAWQRKR